MIKKELKSNDMKKYAIQFLFVTANKYEKIALEQKLIPMEEDTVTSYSGTDLDYTIGYFGNYLVAHTHLPQQGSQKAYGATLSIQVAYKEIDPLCVILVGIAFGKDSSTQSIGDVLVSKSIKSYQSVRRSTGIDGSLITEDRNPIEEPTRTVSRAFEKNVKSINAQNLGYKTFFGTLLTGEELVDHRDYKNKLLECFSSGVEDIIGGEMEAGGLASVMVREENMNWIVVKGISDWGDGDKKDGKEEKQKLAAKNAVDFCLHLFRTDNLKQLKNFKANRWNYDENRNLYLINGYVLFWLRNKVRYSMVELSKKTSIKEKELQNLEKFDICNGKPEFKTIKQKNALKIQKQLKCGIELFQDKCSEQEKFFFENKRQSLFCPPERAKAIVFDFDGTLTVKEGQYSTWQKIWEFLGYSSKQCEALHKQYCDGEINHKQWCDITAEYFIRAKLKRDDVIRLSQEIVLMNGVEEVLKELYSENIPVYVCSGSIDIVIESVLGELEKYIKEIVCNRFTYDTTGTELKAIAGTKFDFKGKSDYIKKIANTLGICTNDIIFVGNSNNDEFAVQSGVKTLVINPKLTDGYNKKIWQYYAGQNVRDLRNILPFFLPDKYHLKVEG